MKCFARYPSAQGSFCAALLWALLAALLSACGASPGAAYPASAPEPYGGPMGAAEARAAADMPTEAAPLPPSPQPSPAPAAFGGPGAGGGAAGAAAAPYAPGAQQAGASTEPEATSKAQGEQPGGKQPLPGKTAGPTKSSKSDAAKPPRGAKQAPPEEPKAVAPAPPISQMLIYTAETRLQIEQEAFAPTIDRIVDLAVSMGGYLATHDNASVQIRVPSLRFRETLKEIEKLGLVTNRSVQVQDVSEEYADLEVRLKSLKATRDRLEQFLGRAKDIAEVLSIEKELGRVNAEIDRIEGRMRFLSSRASFSTIPVRLEPKPRTVVAVDPNREPPPPPPPRTIVLPIKWLNSIGLDHLLQLQ
jgi:hypothetical protein